MAFKDVQLIKKNQTKKERQMLYCRICMFNAHTHTKKYAKVHVIFFFFEN